MVDTLRQDHLAAYGYPRDAAPTLDRLLGEAAVLDGLSPSPWTKPALASLVTGLHPLRHQAQDEADALPREARTLAQVLKARGYATLGVCANLHVDAGAGFARGFDRFVSLADGRGEDLAREALARVAGLRAPYFLYAHYIDPHAPYEPRRAWTGARLPARAAARGALALEALQPALVRERPADLMADVVDLYDGEIREADDGVARLLSGLDAAGLRANTITVVASDHGEELQDHGRMGHGRTLYAEVLKVPLAVHAPGRVPAGRREGVVSLLDVFPTVLGLLGAPCDTSALDGLDLSGPLGAGSALPRTREHLLHLDYYGGAAIGIVRWPWKAVLSSRHEGPEFFDLRADPGEHTNGRSPVDGGAALGRSLVLRYRALRARALPRVRREPLDEATMARLEALGYVDPGGGEEARNLPAVLPLDADGGLGVRVPGPPACATLADRRGGGARGAGWYSVEGDGRWSAPRAYLELGLPPAATALALRLRGVNPEKTPARFSVSVDDRPVASRAVPPGRFEARMPLLPVANDRVLVRLDRTPPFVPARLGLVDDRMLGVFLTEACVVAATR